MKDLGQWQQTFDDMADNLSNGLLEDAKENAKTYREASTYIKRANQLAYGDITESLSRASKTIAGAVCSLALYKLHEEERDMPIKGDKE